VQRVARWALILLAVAVFGAAGYVVTHNDPVRDAGQTPGLPVISQSASSPPTSPSTSLSTSPLTSMSTSASPTHQAADPKTVVAFLGDDWTSGVGASKNDKRFTTLLTTDLHVIERNFGVDGTGYAKSSASGGAYADRVAAVAAANPSVIIVSGGRNDTSDDGDTAAQQAKQLFTTLHAKLPNAVLIAIAPMWGDSDEPPELVALATAIRKGVTEAGGTYLEIADPIHNHANFMADDADPDDNGYAAIASALKPEIRPLLPRST
jgi:lysophospholipase L1-like esterase